MSLRASPMFMQKCTIIPPIRKIPFFAITTAFDQFLKLWIGAGMRPSRFTKLLQSKRLTGMIGA